MQKGFLIWFMLSAIALGAYAQSIEVDKKLGAENAKMVEEQMGIYELEKLNAYVTKVGNRLVDQLKHHPFDFQFFVVDDPTPNAFALPGGYIYVTRGILSLITNEDELAGIMGHEIVHAYNRHSVKQMKKSFLPKLLEVPGMIVGQVVDEDLGNLLNTPIQTSNSLLLASYSRKDETEADDLGSELASRAGYDPQALAVVLDRLSNAIEMLTNEQEQKSYFDDHPFTPDRIKRINKRTSKLTWSPVPVVAPDYPQPLDGMIFGVNPKEGVFEDSLFLHPDLGFAITFPEGWDTTNQPQAVGAINPDRNAVLFLALDNPDSTPVALGTSFVQSVKREYGRNFPIESGEVQVHEYDGYAASFVDKTNADKMYLYVLWVKMEDNLFKIIGTAPSGQEEVLRLSAETLHPITQEERDRITKMEFMVVDARKGETYEQILAEYENTLSPELVAFLNGGQIEDVFDEDRKIKVLVERPY